MAELADALDLGSSSFGVQVRFLFGAQQRGRFLSGFFCAIPTKSSFKHNPRRHINQMEYCQVFDVHAKL